MQGMEQYVYFFGFLKKEDNLVKENFETFCSEKMILSPEFLVEKSAFVIKSKFCTRTFVLRIVSKIAVLLPESAPSLDDSKGMGGAD